MKRVPPLAVVLCLLWTFDLCQSAVQAQDTTFSYQGQLQNNGNPANGTYDLQFTLFATNVSGLAIAGPVTNMAVTVSNGLFVTVVDLGNAFNGTRNWLEIAVSTNGANAFTILTPRQPVRPVPYAIFANTASNLSGSLPAAQLSGTITNANLPASPSFSGTLFANLFIGDGSGLTNLPVANINGLGTLATASAVSSNNVSGQINVGQIFGTIPNSSLPSNVLTNGYKNSISLPTSVSANTITAATVTAGALIGDGSRLTNLPVANISGLGTLATVSAVSSNNVSGQINVGQIFGTIPNGSLPSNVLTNGDTNSISLPTSVSANTITAATVTAGAFIGNGSSLTNVAVANISGLGTLATVSAVSSNNVSGQINVGQIFGVIPNSSLPSNVLTNGYTDSVVFAGNVTVNTITQTNANGTNVFAGPIVATNLIALQDGYVPYTNLNPVIYA